MMKAIIVDDEIHARELLKLEIEAQFPIIDILSSAENIETGRKLIEEYQPDIVFLDIEMPDGTGLDLLKDYPDKDFYPVFVTSHAEYAIDAIKEHAFDYLLKPVDPKELKECLDKIIEGKRAAADIYWPKIGERQILELREKDGITYIKPDNIRFLKADGSYTEVHTHNRCYFISKNLKIFEEQLNKRQFYRANHNLLINLNEVEKFLHEGNYVHLRNGETLRVSVRRKEGFLKAMRRLSI